MKIHVASTSNTVRYLVVLSCLLLTVGFVLSPINAAKPAGQSKQAPHEWEARGYSFETLPGSQYPSNNLIQFTLPNYGEYPTNYPPPPILLMLTKRFASPTAITGTQLTAHLRMDVVGDVTFQGYTEYSCTSGTQPGLWFYITSEDLSRHNPPLNVTDRWWSWAHVDLAAIGSGATVSAFLNVLTDWTDANGDSAAAHPVEFAEVLAGTREIGLTGGGPCVRHGVFTTGSGTATVTLENWSQ